MKYSNTLSAIVMTAALVTLSGCEDTPESVALPEVNDKNCMKVEISKIQPESARKEFSGLCSRRGTDVQRSPDVGLSVK